MANSRHPLEQVLGHRFGDPSLLALALTHRGARAARTRTNGAGNERLEFVGDRVLGLVIAHALFRLFPEEQEGTLAARLASLVSAVELGRVAQEIDLAPHIKLAAGQSLDPATTAILADACEAVIGALYLDAGLAVAEQFIMRHWADAMRADVSPPKDPKMALQEWAQGRGLSLPVYNVVAESGPAHAPSFIMSVAVQGYPEARGEGRTKRLATQAAAASLLERLEGGS